MAALYAYFDESGKSHQHDVVTFSGFISTWDRWQSLGEEWRRILRQCNIPALKFSEHKRRTSVMKKFIHVMRTEIEFGLSVSVKVEAFESLPDHLKTDLGGDPHHMAFRTVLMAMIRRMTAEPGTVINFTCDEDESTTLNCYKWYKEFKREYDEAREKLVSFCVADDVYLPQLQAADVFAGLSRAEAELRLLGRSYDFGELFEEFARQDGSGRLHFATLFCDDSSLRELAEDFEGMTGQLGHSE